MSHEVYFRPPERELGRSDVDFVVKQDGKNLGTLKVSRGSLVWFPGKTYKKGLKIDWGAFDQFMKRAATQHEAR
jgi:hypothetical protein